MLNPQKRADLRVKVLVDSVTLTVPKKQHAIGLGNRTDLVLCFWRLSIAAI